MTGVLRFHEKSWSLTYWPQFLTDSKNFFAKIYDWVTPPYQVGVNRIKRNYVRSQISTCRRLRLQISLKITRIDLPTPIFELFQKFVRQNLWLGHTPIPSRCEQDQKKFCQISNFNYRDVVFMKNPEIWPTDPNFWPIPKIFSPKSMIGSHPHTKWVWTGSKESLPDLNF